MADGGPRVEYLLDWKAPNYAPIFRARLERIRKIRADPYVLKASKVYYRDHIADFIQDWGLTVDVRNTGQQARSTVMPFVLFPQQRLWIEWFVDHWLRKRDGLTEKSRDCGISWLAMAASASLCMLYRDVSIGFGSAKEDKVDRSGDPDTLFYKGRYFSQHVPREYSGDWNVKKHSAHMRLQYPHTDSSITGEAGDNIGRGGRKSIFVVDESAHLERPKLVDASLSATTDTRIDVSSVNGMANSFAERRHGGLIDVFTFSWRDDPRKDAAWYEAKKAALDPVVVAQEIDINYTASTEGIIIPQEWVQAAIDAHLKLGIKASGERTGAFDVADLGRDKCALASRQGVLLEGCVSWRGATTGDITASTEHVFLLCDQLQLESFSYDADGMGADVRGPARVINARRAEQKVRQVYVTDFRGSGEVMDAERNMPGTDRKNGDFFENFKAQSWWSLRARFRATWQWVTKGIPCDPDDIISISSAIAERGKLCIELSQPVWKLSKNGKVMIDKQPDGVASPNLADSVMMAYSPRRGPMVIHPDLLEAFGAHSN